MLIFLAACSSKKQKEQPGQSLSDQQLTEGRELAMKNCQGCHVLPQPDLLDKKSWKNYVLPKMGPLLGITGTLMDNYPNEKREENKHLFPSNPLLTQEEWQKIVDYYVALAPDTLLSGDRPIIKTDLSHFNVRIPEAPARFPVTSLVKIYPPGGYIFFADATTKKLYKASASGLLLDSISLTSAPSHLDIRKTEMYVLEMGIMNPSDRREGTLTGFNIQKEKYLVKKAAPHLSTKLLTGLPRPVHATYADLNGDSKEDVIVSGFGNYTGELSWYENSAAHTYIKHTLRNLPGAVKTIVHDFDQDKLPDIIALMAQGDEGFSIFYNKGNNQFKEERIMRFHPAFGANSFELHDFNGDGYLDILATNGDNGDYPPVLKPYHGIRIYINNGTNQFKEQFFFPVNGANKALATDFDLDGDLDIACISYFPDYEKSPQESFVYLENRGNFDFNASSFSQATAGRWITMDSGDIDKDGDEDIVLGSALLTMGEMPAYLKKQWNGKAPSILILENTTR